MVIGPCCGDKAKEDSGAPLAQLQLCPVPTTVSLHLLETGCSEMVQLIGLRPGERAEEGKAAEPALDWNG